MAPSSPRVSKQHEGEWLEEITWRAERVLRGESNGKAVDEADLAAIFYGEGTAWAPSHTLTRV